MVMLVATQRSVLRFGQIDVRPTRSGLASNQMPLLPHSRQRLVVRSVAMPSGAGKDKDAGVPAAAAPPAQMSKLRQLITPFSDPQANSKMLALASGMNE